MNTCEKCKWWIAQPCLGHGDILVGSCHRFPPALLCSIMGLPEKIGSQILVYSIDFCGEFKRKVKSVKSVKSVAKK